ncbi:MAG: ATP-binding protein [Planctomycetaceae bacterium]|jgi:type II secretory pathway predicted ATPase ExeA|nr:ATP-binding protein [Planctomycetaceae bacterium]
MKHFNVAGPCNEQDHYKINSATRLQGVDRLIDHEQYFVIHAARQTGKTTYLKDLARQLNAEGKYYAFYISLETASVIKEPETGIPAIVRKIKDDITYTDLPHSSEFAKDADYEDFTGVFQESLRQYSMLLDKPLVVLFDEVDSLSEGVLNSFLRQLRSGYNERSMIPFVHSVALVGMRNIRDYKARPNDKSFSSASPFNIVTKVFTLNNFTKDEIAQLYHQHTVETGQTFDDAAVELVFEQTQGQPWLVNAIAYEMTKRILKSDYKKPVTSELVSQAIQNILIDCPTHIDYLMEHIKEEHIRSIIEPMIIGDQIFKTDSDVFLYVCELGLISHVNWEIKPANQIYSDAIVRLLTYNTQQNLPSYYDYEYYDSDHVSDYFKDGCVDINLIMSDFQKFWRENGDTYSTACCGYTDAAPHLILLAFLRHAMKGRGQVLHKLLEGSGKLELLLVYNDKKYPIEIKIRYNQKKIREGFEQTVLCMENDNYKEGWLVVFDQRIRVKWDKKFYIKKKIRNGKKITIVGT